MPRRNAGSESDAETPRKRTRLMVAPDGFQKPKTKPISKPSVPKFSSGFDGASSSSKQEGRVAKVEARTSRPITPDARNTANPKHTMRALKPPIPLFDSGSKSTTEPVAAANLHPLQILHPPTSKNSALRHLVPPPPPSAPIASFSKSTTPLKPLTAPPLPVSATALSSDVARTISTTLIARATDLFTDNGPSELASIFLQDQYSSSQFLSPPENIEEQRGVMMSPEKGGKGKEKYVRNGLASRAAALFDRSNASLSLWEAEMTHFLSSAASSSKRSLNPDMRLRIVHVLHIPSPVPHPSSKSSIPGVALCHLLSSANPHPSGLSLLPQTKDGLCAVLFSFSAISPPAVNAPMQLHIRNPEDFVQGREVYVWKPWQIVAIDVGAIQQCIDNDSRQNLDQDGDVAMADVDMTEVEAFELFEPGTTGAWRRGKVADTALVCERFVISK